MGRGRKPQEVVKLNKSGREDNIINLLPLTNNQVEKAGIDSTEEVFVKREVREGEEEIRLQLSNEKEELYK